MKAEILWSGRYADSIEYCSVRDDNSVMLATSTIVGSYEKIFFRLHYKLQVDAALDAMLFHAHLETTGVTKDFVVQKNLDGCWSVDGHIRPEFKNCIAIDIPLTPLTNTLPIRKLKLGVGAERIIDVVYADLLQGNIYPVHQKYTRMDANIYHYQNVPNDFEAAIEVDDNDLVVSYPTLFERTGFQQVH